MVRGGGGGGTQLKSTNVEPITSRAKRIRINALSSNPFFQPENNSSLRPKNGFLLFTIVFRIFFWHI
jgi:hypothetical protein